MGFYLAIRTAVELMCERCESMGKMVEDLFTRVAQLEQQIENLKTPDYIPDDVKISDWERVRDLDHKERELELDIRRMKELGDIKVDLHPTFESRLESAKSEGFVWPTRRGEKPSRQSTRKRMLDEWEEQYKQGCLLSDEEIIDVGKVGEIGAGAIHVAVRRLTKITGNTSDLEGLNTYNKYQKLVKLVKGSVATNIPIRQNNSIDYSPIAESLRSAVFGDSLDAENGPRVTELFIDRLEKAGGVNGLTPDLIKQCCNLDRLPTFFPWALNHISPDSKLFSLKSGQYDHHFEDLLRTFSVESQ